MGQNTSNKYETELDYIYENNIDVHIITDNESNDLESSLEDYSNDFYLNKKYTNSNKSHLNEYQSTNKKSNKICFCCINKKRYILDMNFIQLLYEYVM